jgi:hypothetical protein
MKYRIAKVSDSKSLAKLHMECGLYQQGGFMHKLGIPFLKKYYEIISKNKHCIIVVAENESGQLLGFHSGTLDAKEHYLSLKKCRFKFIIPIIFSLIFKPKLILEIYTRYKYIKKGNNLEFGIMSGIRGEYWCWSPSKPNSIESIKLHRMWHSIIKNLGASYVRSEVDIVNDRIYKSIKIMGGVLLQEITLHDGRRRAIVEYDLTKF